MKKSILIILSAIYFTSCSYILNPNPKVPLASPSVKAYIKSDKKNITWNTENDVGRYGVSLVVEWSEVNGADGYELYLESGDRLSVDGMDGTYSGSDRFYELRNLSENATYTAFVRAVNSDAKSDLTRMTISTGFPPDTFVIKNTYKQITGGAEFNLTWEKVKGAEYYEVYRYESDEKLDSVTWGQYKEPFATTKDCYYIDKIYKTGKFYYWVVRAVNVYGFSVSNGSRAGL